MSNYSCVYKNDVLFGYVKDIFIDYEPGEDFCFMCRVYDLNHNLIDETLVLDCYLDLTENMIAKIFIR